MRRVLIVSPYFPPSTVAGVHRTRILSAHLRDAGWEPVVFCVDERFHEQRLDPDLAAIVPPHVRIVKVQAWPTKLSRTFGLGDLGIRGYHALHRAICGVLESEGADLLFITALPGVPLAMGPALSRTYKIPFVADYQDPWLPAGFEKAFPFGKAWAAHRIAATLEPGVLRNADHVTTVSEGTGELIRSRYAFLSAEKFSAIPIGGEEGDFAYLRGNPRPCPWIEEDRDCITISYVGNVWPRAIKTAEAILAALAKLRHDKPDLARRLRLLFVGSSNQPRDDAPEVVMPLARAAGVAGMVREWPGRVPYLDALNIMIKSDILLLIGSDEIHYTASKLYPALLSERPILGIFHEASAVRALAHRIGGVRMETFGANQPLSAIVPEISRAIEDMVGRPTIPRADRSLLEPYLGPSTARRFADIFERVVARKVS